MQRADSYAGSAVDPSTERRRRGRGRIAVAGVGLALAAVALGLRVRFAFEPTHGGERTFEASLWGLELFAAARGEFARAVEAIVGPLRWTWAALALLAGGWTARRLAPALSIGRVWIALAVAFAVFASGDPWLASFVAGRSFVGAPHYLEVEDALRGIGTAGLVGALIALWPRSHGARPPERVGLPWGPLALAGAVAVLGPAIWSSVFLGGQPLTNDGQSYRFQATLFELGRASLPGGGWAEFFPARQVYAGEQVFSKYPPGHALVLAAGGLLGSPWLLVRLFWFLGPFGVHFLARRLGAGRPLLAAWLFALSPTPLVLGGLWLSHGTSLPAALGFFVAAVGALDALDRGDRRRALGWSVAAGAALGLCGLARPGTALAIALPPLLAVVFQARRAWPIAPAVALGALPAAAFFLAFNAATTGDALLPGYTLYAREVSPDDRWGLVNAALAVEHTALSSARLGLWLHGFAGSAALALIGLAALERRRWLPAGVLVALAGFYALLKFHGLPWAGPLYWVEAFPLLCCASAAAVDRIARHSGEWIVRPLLVGGVIASAVLVHARGDGARREQALRSAHLEAARTAEVEGVVFVTLAGEASVKRTFLAPPPTFVLDGALPEVLFVAGRGPSADAELLRALGGPPAWRFDPRSGALTPLAP